VHSDSSAKKRKKQDLSGLETETISSVNREGVDSPSVFLGDCHLILFEVLVKNTTKTSTVADNNDQNNHVDLQCARAVLLTLEGQDP
jgi:hypothetical protein